MSAPLLSQEFKYRTRKYLAMAAFAAASADIILTAPYWLSSTFTAALLATLAKTAFFAFSKATPPAESYLRDRNIERSVARLSARAGLKTPDVYVVTSVSNAATDLSGNLQINDHFFNHSGHDAETKNSIIAHELAHIRNGDIYGLLALIGNLGIITFAHFAWAASQPSNIVKSAIVLPALGASFSLFMKSTEHLADIGASRLTGTSQSMIRLFENHSKIQAAEIARNKECRDRVYGEFPLIHRLRARLRDKIADFDFHPSFRKRIEVLQQAQQALDLKRTKTSGPQPT